MFTPTSIRDARIAETSERNRLLVLFGVFLLDSIAWAWLQSQESANVLYTIQGGPSYVPSWLVDYWEYYGFTAGAAVILGLWLFAQLARWGTARRVARALEVEPTVAPGDGARTVADGVPGAPSGLDSTSDELPDAVP